MGRSAAILALGVLSTTAYYDEAPNWTAPDEGGTSIYGGVDGSFGMGFGPAGDVNGDGFADVLAAAPLRENGPEPGSGKVVLFLGSATGLSTSAAWTLTGESLGVRQLGHEVGALGDVNADGFGDLFVRSDDGLFGFLGSPTGPGATAHWRVDAITAAAAGDVNDDGFGDVITGNPFGGPPTLAVFFGSAAGLPAAPDWTFAYDGMIHDLGRTVRGLGDVNGDGFDDVAAGNAGNRFDTSGILVFHGSPAGPSSAPDRTYERLGSERFGGDLEGGDFDGDGFADLLTSAHGHGGLEGDPDTHTHVPKAYVFYGSPSGLSPAASFTHEGQGSDFGLFVVHLTDLDGDGLSEIAVATRENLQVFRGAPVGFERVPAQNLPAPWDPQAAGDVNGDGRMDLIMAVGNGGPVGVFYARAGEDPQAPPVGGEDPPPPAGPPPTNPPPVIDPPAPEPPPADPPPAGDPPPSGGGGDAPAPAPAGDDDDDDDRCGALGLELLLILAVLRRRRTSVTR